MRINIRDSYAITFSKSLPFLFTPLSVYLIFPLFVLSFNVSCARSQSQNNGPVFTQPLDNNDIDPLLSIEEIAKKFSLSCENPMDCPENVGMLVHRSFDNKKNKLQLNMCTQFLVGEDFVLSNKHCIPSELQTNGTNCKDHIAFVFSGSGGNIISGCETILQVSNTDSTEKIENNDIALKEFYYTLKTHYTPSSSLTPDYALIKLSKKIKLPFLKLSSEGVPFNKVMKAYSVHFDNKFHPVLKPKLCTSLGFSLLYEHFYHPLNNTASFVDCDIIPGNSGSPLIDPETGTVRAIFFAKLLSLDEYEENNLGKELEEKKKYYSEHPFEYSLYHGKIQKKLSYATNFACKEFKELGFIGRNEIYCKNPTVPLRNTFKFYTPKSILDDFPFISFRNKMTLLQESTSSIKYKLDWNVDCIDKQKFLEWKKTPEHLNNLEKGIYQSYPYKQILTITYDSLYNLEFYMSYEKEEQSNFLISLILFPLLNAVNLNNIRLDLDSSVDDPKVCKKD